MTYHNNNNSNWEWYKNIISDLKSVQSNHIAGPDNSDNKRIYNWNVNEEPYCLFIPHYPTVVIMSVQFQFVFTIAINYNVTMTYDIL